MMTPQDSALTLEQHLALSYQARAMGQGSTAEATAKLRAALDADPVLKVKAQAYLATLTDDVCDPRRCIISSVHRQALREALT